MVKLFNTTRYQIRRHYPLFKKLHTESLHCGRIINAYERHSPQDIQGIFTSWTGLVLPESVEEWQSTPVAGTGRAGPRWRMVVRGWALALLGLVYYIG